MDSSAHTYVPPFPATRQAVRHSEAAQSAVNRMRNGKADVHTDPGKPLLHASIRAGTTNDAAQLTALCGGCVRCRQRRSDELCKRSQGKAHSRCHVGPGPLTHLLHRRGHAAGRNRAEVRAHERLECIERQRTYNLQCVRCMRGRGLGCAQLVDAERRMNAVGVH